MNRFCYGLLTAFRAIQFLLSVVLLGCGAYITYEMFSMSSSAKHVEGGIKSLHNDTLRHNIENKLRPALNISDQTVLEFSAVLDDTLVPVLHFFENTPTRAIIVTATGLCSTILISYLYVVNRKTSNPKLNRRSIRVPLELVMFLLWLVCVTCAIMLAMEYGFIALAGGAMTKIAFRELKSMVEEAMKTLTGMKGDSILRALTIVDDLVTISALSILAVPSACICATVALMSLIVTCCMSGQQKAKKSSHGSDAALAFLPGGQEKNTKYAVIGYPSPMSTMTPITPATSAHIYYPNNQGWNGYHAI